MQPIKVYQVDAFSDQAFRGNPAAVCPLDRFLEPTLMQAIARENNLSETAFIVPVKDGQYCIRWFAPKGEVELCGHGTLAAGLVVMKFLEPLRSQVEFVTPLHRLFVEKRGERYVMRFPAFSYREKSADTCLKELFHPALEGIYEGNETLVLRLSTEEDVKNYRTNLAFLRENNIYLSITAPGKYSDFVSRFFAPVSGIDEDPVTGSVHCLLAPIWSKILGKKQLTAIQVSDRPGELVLTLDDQYVFIEGPAVCVLIGELFLQGVS